MDNLDYIDSFFTNEPHAESKGVFEERIKSDPSFAEEVAFYLTSQQTFHEASGNEKKEQFRKLFREHKSVRAIPVRKLIPYFSAAAIVAGIVFGIHFFTESSSPKQLAGQYEKEHMQALPVTMSGHSDSLQMGLRLFNEGKLPEALAIFEKIPQSDTTIFFTAREYAGIAALRLKEYEKALFSFEQLEINNGLYANPAPFLRAVTLMERNQPGDANQAKQLLQKIVAQDLDGKEFAQEWLKKW